VPNIVLRLPCTFFPLDVASSVFSSSFPPLFPVNVSFVSHLFPPPPPTPALTSFLRSRGFCGDIGQNSRSFCRLSLRPFPSLALELDRGERVCRWHCSPFPFFPSQPWVFSSLMKVISSLIFKFLSINLAFFFLISGKWDLSFPSPLTPVSLHRTT